MNQSSSISTQFQVLLSNSKGFICTNLNDFKYCYLVLIIIFNIIRLNTVKGFRYCYLVLVFIFNIIHSFTHSLMVPSIAI